MARTRARPLSGALGRLYRYLRHIAHQKLERRGSIHVGALLCKSERKKAPAPW